MDEKIKDISIKLSFPIGFFVSILVLDRVTDNSFIDIIQEAFGYGFLSLIAVAVFVVILDEAYGHSKIAVSIVFCIMISLFLSLFFSKVSELKDIEEELRFANEEIDYLNDHVDELESEIYRLK